jgi:hypothetical protein
MQTVADQLYSVWLGEYSVEMCDRCIDIAGFKNTKPCDVIAKPEYMTMCVVCMALPPMVLGKCSDCGERNVHPYDQYHAEGWCSNE